MRKREGCAVWLCMKRDGGVYILDACPALLTLHASWSVYLIFKAGSKLLDVVTHQLAGIFLT